MRTPKPLPLLAGILLTACGTAPNVDHLVPLVAMNAAASGEQRHGQFSMSLRDEPITTETGIVTTAEAAGVNRAMGADQKRVVELTKGVYVLLGWGIGAVKCIRRRR